MQALRSDPRLRLALLAVLALLMLLAVRPAAGTIAPSGDDGFRVRYAAHDFYVVGPDLAAAVVDDRTGIKVAPLGSFRFTAVGSDASLTIDDVGESPMIPVYVSSPSTGRWHCVPNHTPTTFGGLQAGKLVHVYLVDVTYGYGMCGGGATVGVASVTP
jgi:hypothetical protein